jgi:predicted XRE-type DNA-binding protein
MKKTKTIINKTASDLADSLGLSSSDALEWEVRHSITEKIIDTAKKKELSVTQLAKDAGTSRGRVTKILKDDTFGISLDVLFRVLGATGQKVKLSYRKAA